MTPGFRRGARLGIDFGNVRIGVASCDPDGILASPVATVPRDDDGQDIAAIRELVLERSVIEVIVGLPRHLSGVEGESAAAARSFAAAVARAITPVGVRVFDERFSSVVAHQALRQSGRATRDHRATVDQVAATLILESALDFERSQGAPPGVLVS